MTRSNCVLTLFISVAIRYPCPLHLSPFISRMLIASWRLASSVLRLPRRHSPLSVPFPRSALPNGGSQLPRDSRHESASDELRSRLTLLERELLTEQTKRELLESQVSRTAGGDASCDRGGLEVMCEVTKSVYDV